MAGKENTSRRYRLSSQDATFIYAETPNGPLHIGSIPMFEVAKSISTTSCNMS